MPHPDTAPGAEASSLLNPLPEHESTPEGRASVGVRGSGWVLLGALALGAVASLFFMKSVLAAPVAGDDRLWYPEVAALDSFSVADALEQLACSGLLEVRLTNGLAFRYNPLADMLRARVAELERAYLTRPDSVRGLIER